MAVGANHLTLCEFGKESIDADRGEEPRDVSSLVADVVEIHGFGWKALSAVSAWT